MSARRSRAEPVLDSAGARGSRATPETVAMVRRRAKKWFLIMFDDWELFQGWFVLWEAYNLTVVRNIHLLIDRSTFALVQSHAIVKRKMSFYISSDPHFCPRR